MTGGIEKKKQMAEKKGKKVKLSVIISANEAYCETNKKHMY